MDNTKWNLLYRCRGVDYKYAGMILQALMDNAVFNIWVDSHFGYEIHATFVNTEQMDRAKKEIDEKAPGVFCEDNRNFYWGQIYHEHHDFFGTDIEY